MKLTVNIFKDFINTLTVVGEVTSFSDDGTSTTLNVNATFHVRRGMNITINAVDFLVESVVIDTTIVITGLPVGITFYSVDPPFYFHGTPIGVNQETNAELVSKKAPMIYLYEQFSETEMDENSSIVRESQIRLFFLDTADFENWDTEDYYSIRLEGLNSFVDQFILAYRKSRSFRSFDTTFDRTNFSKWGVIANNRGAISNIFDDELTGVELTFTAKLTDCDPDTAPFIPVCPPPPTTFDELVSLIGRGYNYPQPTGQETIYRTGDDADIEQTIFALVRAANSLKAQNSLSSNWLILNNNNSFGNTNRFTDSVGGQNYDGIAGSFIDYVVDNYTGLAWFRIQQTNIPWNNAIDNAFAFVQSGFSDWFLPSRLMYDGIKFHKLGTGNFGLTYPPFNLTGANMWAGTTNPAFTVAAYLMLSSLGTGQTAKTSNQFYLICRKHF